MKILAYDRDSAYLKRLSEYLAQYASEMQIFSFASAEQLLDYAEREEFDMVLCCAVEEDASRNRLKEVVATAPFAWLSPQDEEIYGEATIFKYQSIPKIYNRICDLYESAYQRRINRKVSIQQKQHERIETKILTFFPVHGGAGSSVMAIACARKFSQEQPVLYLNFEQFQSGSYYQSENEKCFSDIITEIKGKYRKDTLQKMIDLCTCRDESVQPERMHFIKACKGAAELTRLDKRAMLEILDLLRSAEKYAYIIIDASMVVGELTEALIQCADKLIFTSDASDEAVQKMKQVRRYVQLSERSQDKYAEQYLIYNKYYADAELSDHTSGMVVVGKFGRYRFEENRQIKRETVVKQICLVPDVFEKLK